MEPKRTTKIDSWKDNNELTLEELFKFESQLLDLMERKKKESNQRVVKELEAEEKELQERIHKAYLKDIEDQERRRKESNRIELEEYKLLLEKKRDAEIKDEAKRNKQKEKDEKKVAALKKAQEREEVARQTREANQDKQNRRAAREELLEASKLQWGGAGGWKNSGDQMRASLEHAFENGLKSIGKAFEGVSNKINSLMDTFSKYQSSIDTRLQGTNKTFEGMQTTLKRAVGASPYLKTEDMLTNLQTLVETGIVTNVEQRAFLETIKDKVAGTFDAANSSLLRIIRLQQNDSTAARLGMEAYLTDFLNRTVENTEYLKTTFDNVQSALLEASSLMSTAGSTEFEYVVQKWLGALTGRGLSDTTATNIASAIGMLGAGNVSGLSGNALNNLLVMAASRAGLDYGDLLSGGLTAESTNRLMKAMVTYMQEIGASGSNVVRSQYAQTFGLTVSDLVAASGIGVGKALNQIADNLMDYNSMYEELGYQLDQVTNRTHISEKINNLFENAQFSLASNIASNAALAGIWKVTDMIQGVTGGINIPMISAMGNAIDLETTVENLMKLGIVGIGSFGMIADVVTGLAQSGSEGDIEEFNAEPEHGASFALAKHLLNNGCYVLYQIITDDSATLESGAEEDVKANWTKRFEQLKDKGLYDVKFITLGEFAGVGHCELSNLIGCADKRGDCVALIDHPEDIDTALFESGEDITDYALFVHNWAKSIDGTSSNMAMFSPWCSNTMFNDGKTFLPPSFSFLAAFANSVKTNPNWLAAAGAFRGAIPGLVKAEHKYGEKDIDTLQCRNVVYANGVEGFGPGDNVGIAVNPICNVNPFGIIIWGNRTGLNNGADGLKATSFLNVRILACDIKKTMWNAARKFTFEQNTLRLWLRFCSDVRPLLDEAKTGEGITSYRFIKEQTTAKGRLKARVRIVPIEAVEDFDLTFVLDDTIETEESVG